jgi:hypothetical protein
MKKEVKGNKARRVEFRRFLSLVILLSLILLFVLGLSFYLNYKKPLFSSSLLVKAAVGGEFGLSLSGEELDFGRTIPGFPVSKDVRLKNYYDFPVRVEVILDPMLIEIIYGAGEFYMRAGEEYNYSVVFYPNDDISYGDYRGNLTFNFYSAS